MTPRSHRVVPLMAIVPLALVACGGDGGSGDFSSSDGFSVTRALTQLPAIESDGVLQVSMADLLATSAANGVEPPEASSEDRFNPWLTGSSPDSRVFAVPPAGWGENNPRSYAEATGLSIIDVEVFSSVLAAPDQFTVFGGDLGDTQFPETVTELHDGIVSIGDGEDYSVDPSGGNRDVDRLGRPVRMARDGDRFATSLSTSQMEGWVSGEADTLAEGPLGPIGEALDDADVVSAALFAFPEPDPDESDQSTPERRDELGIEERPGAFRAVGLGWAAEDGESVMTVVYDFGSDDVAAASSTALELVYREGVSTASRQPISDLFELERIETDGPLVLVTLRNGPDGRAAVLYQMVVQRDLPFTNG